MTSDNGFQEQVDRGRCKKMREEEKWARRKKEEEGERGEREGKRYSGCQVLRLNEE